MEINVIISGTDEEINKRFNSKSVVEARQKIEEFVSTKMGENYKIKSWNQQAWTHAGSDKIAFVENTITVFQE